jgi:serine/threonine-protein kinase
MAERGKHSPAAEAASAPPVGDPRSARRPVERPPLDWDSDTIPDLGDLPRGAMVGEYRIRRKLAEGGMGTVYAAIHPIIERKVAIKVLHASLSKDQNVVARFVQEARAACRVGHPGIVDVFGFGDLSDGRQYIIMEYLHGQQLLMLLRERAPLSLEVALPIVRGICDPLAAAHRVNVIHRDLKPENVFLVPRPDGEWPPRVKVLDFGLAKLLENRLIGPTTKTGTTLGTCYYMPPEQCRGLEVDARSDIYSLGVMMYEMMTGRVPYYSTSSVEIMLMHLQREPEPPSQHATIDPEMERLILNCVAKSPEQRPQSMQEVLARLAAIEEAQRRAADSPAREIAAVSDSLAKAAYHNHAPEGPLEPSAQHTLSSLNAHAQPKAAPKGRLVVALAIACGLLTLGLGVAVWLLLAR